MPIRYVNPAAAPGGDGTTPGTSGGNHAYNTQVACIVGEAGLLTEQLEVRLMDGTTDERPDWDGFSGVTETNNIKFTKYQPSDGHQGVPGNGYKCINDGGNTIDFYEPWTEIEDVSIGNANSTWFCLKLRNDADNCKIRRVIFYGYNGGGAGYGTDSTGLGTNPYFESCLFYNLLGSKGALDLEASVAVLGRNITIAKCYEGVSNAFSGQKRTFHNSVSYGSTPGVDWTGGNASMDLSTYCASGDGTAPAQTGTVVSNSITDADFVNPAGNDWNLASGSVLVDGGGASEMATLDLAGNPFSTNDVGCYAFSSGPPDLALDQTMPGIATAVAWNIEFQANLDLTLDATFPGAGTVDWDVGTTLPLQTTLPGAGTVNWDLFEEGAQDFPLATTLAGIGTAAGWSAGIEFTMAATWPGGSSQDWTVAIELALATTLSAAATIDWNAALELPLATTLQGAGTIDWSIEGQNGLVAQLNGVATAFDSELGWEALLANTFPGAATINWDLVQEVPGDEALIATFNGVATTPAWSAIPELPLVAAFPGIGTAAAWNLSLDSDLTLATTLAGVANAVDWNAGREEPLATTLPGIGTQDWNLSGDETLATTLQGFATPDWYGSLDFPLFITLPGLTNVDDWSISRGGLDIPIFATAVRDVTPWPTVVDL